MARSTKLLCLALLCSHTVAYGAGFPWGKGRDGKIETPAKVLPFWSEGVLNQPDRPGTRGVGGRLLFYGKDHKKTVRVKGTLVVYVFDEDGRDPANVTPDRKYVYTPEDFEKTHAKNEFGHSYNIWVPWDDVGGPQKDLSLIVRFTSETGELVVSEQQKQRLTGVPTSNKPEVAPPQLAGAKLTVMPPGASAATMPPALQQAAFQQAGPSANSPATSSGVILAAAMQPANPVQQAAMSAPSNSQSTMLSPATAIQQAAALQPVPNAGAAQTATFPDGQRRMETTTIQMPPISAARWAQSANGNSAQTPTAAQTTWPMSQYAAQPNQFPAGSYLPPNNGFNGAYLNQPAAAPNYSASAGQAASQAAPPGAFYAHGSLQPLSQKLQSGGMQQAGNGTPTNLVGTPTNGMAMPTNGIGSSANGMMPFNGAGPTGNVAPNSTSLPSANQPTGGFQNANGFASPGFTGPSLGSPAAQQNPPNLMQGQAAAAPTQFGAHYVPGTRPAPTWQSGQPGLGPAQWQQFPAVPRFGQPALPGQGQ